jgi:SPP1 gp7 family putative phage head morphogenesis protein
MGLVFHNGKFIPEQNIQKGIEEAQVLRLLRSFLDANEPGLVRILVNTWQSQGKAITYKEIREAILRGDIDPKWLDDWMQDYAKLVEKYMQPAWEKAIEAGFTSKAQKYPAFYFNPMADSIRTWAASHAAAFITNVSTTQIEGIRAVVQRAAVLENLSVDELSRVIRPMVGLTKQQSNAVMNYYQTLREKGVSPKRAREMAIRDAARRHRERAYSVARTELATAYNSGAHEAVKQAQAKGYMGRTVKVWCAADDERMCPYCDDMDGKEIDIDEDFDGISSSWSTRLHPPAHPGCRCAALYVEKEPPEKNM